MAQMLPFWAGPTLLVGWLWLQWLTDNLIDRITSKYYFLQLENPLDAHRSHTASYRPRCTRILFTVFSVCYLLAMVLVVAADCTEGVRDVAAWVSLTVQAVMLSWVFVEGSQIKAGANGSRLTVPALSLHKAESLIVPIYFFITSSLVITEAQISP